MTIQELINYLNAIEDKSMRIGITTYDNNKPCTDLARPRITADPNDRTYKPDNILVIYVHM